LYRLAARATLTGASLVDALSALVAETRAARRAAALADARRLSVRLLFPLALLILPGFVVLVAGPVVIDGIARLDL
jgi:pilus assembly protein TadC